MAKGYDSRLELSEPLARSRLESMRTIVFFLFPAVMVCAEWPQFRGPASNPVGADKRLAERWSKKENVEWSVEIPGRGWSSPVVTGGKVFVTAATTDGKSKVPQAGTEYSNQYIAELLKQGLKEAQAIERVMERDIELPREVTLHYFLYCLDLATGATVWKREMYAGRPPGGRHRKNSFTSETPVTDGELVYVYVANLGLYAYKVNGDLAWTSPLEALPMYMDLGAGASPALHGNLLFVLHDNEKQQFLAAFDKRTGKRVWRTERNLTLDERRTGWATPFVWTNPLRTEVVTIGPGVAASYDLEGKELWRLGGMASVPVPSAFAYDGLLYIDGGMRSSLFAVKPGGAVAWSEQRAGTYLPTPVAYESGIYALDEKGIIARYDAKTGKQSYKARIDPEAGTFTSSPWAYNGKVFCLNEEGKTYVIEAGAVFRLLHSNPLDEMAQATPAIVGDRLVLRTEARLYSIRRPAR